MQAFLMIIVDIIVPVFILIAIGAWLHRKTNLNLQTLSSINIYLLIPAIIFVKLYETELSWDIFLSVFFFFVILVAVLYVLCFIISRLLRHSKGMKIAFSNSTLFYNSGNYGVPVNDLVFKGDTFAMSIQILILTFQNIFTFSYGVFALQSVNGYNAKMFLGYFKMPVFYAMLCGILFNAYGVKIPSFAMVPAEYVASALIPIALVTLGAQVAYFKIKEINVSILFSLLLRLILGPCIAMGIIFIFQLDGVIAQALFISSAMPTSVNSSIIAQYYNNEPDFAAQVVFVSTLFSSLTVTLVIYLSQLFYG